MTPRRRSTTSMLLLAVVLAAQQAHARMEHQRELQETNSADAWKSQQYLLPILRAGPNNQLRHLRFMLALAKQLNRTLILTGIFKHYTDRGTRYSLPKPGHANAPAHPSARFSRYSPRSSLLRGQVGSAGSTDDPATLGKCFKEETPYQIDFSEILDREYVQEFTPVTTAEEMKAAGWDGVLDALVYPNSTYPLEKVIPYLGMTVAAAKVAMYHDLGVVQMPHVLRCNPDTIEWLRQKIARWRVVAMMFSVIGNEEVVSLVNEGTQAPTQSCWRDLFHANRRLKANAWLQGIARQYVETHVGSGPYLAMHVRPQADGCWKLWMQRNFDEAALSRKGVCWAGHAALHTVVGPKAAAAMAAHNLSRLVVLTHPHLQPVITEMLAKVNLSATYIVPRHVARIAGCHDTSSTFLMLVEMQVAVQSTVFLGTASSSITETVLYERLAVGNTANSFLDRPYPQLPHKSHPTPSHATRAWPVGTANDTDNAPVGRISGLQPVDVTAGHGGAGTAMDAAGTGQPKDAADTGGTQTVNTAQRNVVGQQAGAVVRQQQQQV